MTPQKKRRRESEPVADAQIASTTSTADQVLATDAAPPRKKQQQRRSLFVRSLPATATTESLISHFSQSFPIKHATAVIDKSTKTCKGYGFVTFADAEDAERALKDFNGSLFEGRKLKIEVAEPRHRDVEDSIPGAVAAGEAKPRSVPSAVTVEAKAKREQEKKEAYRLPKLIIRNLPWSIKKPEQLADLFRSYGKVKHATIPSKKPGLQAGFGFIVLRGKANAEKALAGVNGKEIDGRTLAVDWAVEKEIWQGHTKAEKGEGVEGEDMDEDSHVLGATSAKVDVEDEEEDEDMADEDSNQGFSDVDSDKSLLDDEEVSSDEEETANEKQASTSTTLFLRNLPFTSTDEALKDHFSRFGPVRYARIVLDPATERPKGVAFVCFYNPADALQCLKDAPRPSAATTKPNKPSAANSTLPSHSVLQNDFSDLTGDYTLDGRVLVLSKAVDRSEAVRLTEAGIAHRGDRDKDRRRLYLLSEGTISASSPLHALLSPSEIAMREASVKQRKTLIQSNPSLHLSLTRLSVRNVPRAVTSKDLKALAREAVVGFATDVKGGKRQRLSKEELARGGPEMAEAEKERKKKGTGIVKQAKVVFEGREGGKVEEGSGAGRSRGYGFVEYHSHRAALMGLRWLNGHAVDYQTLESVVKGGNKGVGKEEVAERRKRLIVEFAIENAQVVHRRSEREGKAREGPRDGKARGAAATGQGGPDLFTVGKKAKAGGVGVAKPVVGAKGARSKAVGGGGAEDAKPDPVGADDKGARRQRIIARKRNLRRERRKGA